MSSILMSDAFTDVDKLTECLGVDVNDIPLLYNIATIHTPQLSQVCHLNAK